MTEAELEAMESRRAPNPAEPDGYDTDLHVLIAAYKELLSSFTIAAEYTLGQDVRPERVEETRAAYEAAKKARLIR
jgi:hypothetical protein